MKILKYLTYSLVLSLMVVSCDKHEIAFDTTPALDAEFQLHYFEPIVSKSANYIDSVFINDVLYSSVAGNGALATYNGVPSGSTGKFFAVKSGVINIKLYRGKEVKNADGTTKKVPELIYNQNCELTPGKQNVFVHDLAKEPVVVDNHFPYWPSRPSNVATFDTDSVASVMFVNLLYETPGVTYAGALQYQYEDVRTGEWVNIGAPVLFGQATERTHVKVVKDSHNSWGTCDVNYRILDENGNVLQVMNTYGNMIDYADYWSMGIGRAHMHILRGYRMSTPVCGVSRWWSK